MNTLLYRSDSSGSNLGWIVILAVVLIWLTIGIGVLWLGAMWKTKSIEKAEVMMAEWARNNGWQLLEFRQELNTGPFGGWHGRTELYFQFVICDQQGRKRKGWVRLDYGIFSRGKFDVKWTEGDETSPLAGGA